MYKLFLTLRYLRSRKIAYFAMAAVTLCVAMVLIVMSVMGGWLDQLMWRAKNLLGDVIVENRSYTGFPMYEEFIAEISRWDEITQATPVIHTLGMLRFPDQPITRTVSVVGIRLDEADRVTDFRGSLFYEKFYPGTTTLAPARRPLLGLADTTLNSAVDGQPFRPPALPEPYAGALREARRRHAESGSSEPFDPQSTETETNRVMREWGGPQFPGVFEFVPSEPVLTGEPLPGMIIGRDIVARRESDGRYHRFSWLPKGINFSLTLWATSDSGMVDVTPTIAHFRYVDDSRTGIYDIDSRHVYVEFERLQQLLRMEEGERVDDGGRIAARCSQIQVKVREDVTDEALLALTQRMEAVYQRITQDPEAGLDVDELQMAASVEAKTWQQSQAHIIGPVQKEKMLVTLLFGIISLVAVALILCILYMIVLQKTRDIGIIKSIGGSASGVASIFVLYGAFVGLVGAIFGTGLGYVFITNINEIQDWLISWREDWRIWDLQVYSFDRIPDQMKVWDAIIVGVIGVAASTIGSLVAAWRAGTMHPVEALRYE